MNEPLVSIIIPCYNAEAYVGEAIESALAQTYPNIEVIVIDDGSTDDSLDVIRSYERDVRWEISSNKGASAARNSGLGLAKGELVQFLDSDDRLHSDKIARQVTVLSSSEVCSVYCDVRMIDESDHDAGVTVWTHDRGNDAVCMALGSNAGTPTGLHRIDAVRSVGGFDETLPCAQDRDFHLRLAIESFSAAVIPECLVTLIRRQGSLSSDSIRVYEQYPKILMRARDLLIARDSWTSERAFEMALLASRAARACARQRAWLSARTLWNLAGQIDKSARPRAYRGVGRLLARIVGPESLERVVSARQRFGGSK